VALTVDLYPHARNRPQCAGCGQRGPQYDRLAPRPFEFVPLWGLRVFFLYMMRRVDCPRCGATVEQVPWADGKHQLTTTYAWFLARWAKRLSWLEMARVFHTSWDQVFRSVTLAVAWGRDHVDLTGIRSIGIDEIHWQHGPRFLTLVYQIDASRKRLLWIGQHRRAKTLLGFFRWFGKERTAALAFVCSDMWKPYQPVVKVFGRRVKTCELPSRYRGGEIGLWKDHPSRPRRRSCSGPSCDQCPVSVGDCSLRCGRQNGHAPSSSNSPPTPMKTRVTDSPDRKLGRV